MPDILNGWTRLLKLTAGQRRDVLLATLAGIVLLGLSAYLAVGVGLATLVAGTGDPFGLLLGLMGVSHLVFQITLLGRMYRISGTSSWFALGHLPALIVAVGPAGVADRPDVDERGAQVFLGNARAGRRGQRQSAAGAGGEQPDPIFVHAILPYGSRRQ